MIASESIGSKLYDVAGNASNHIHIILPLKVNIGGGEIIRQFLALIPLTYIILFCSKEADYEQFFLCQIVMFPKQCFSSTINRLCKF